MGILDKLLKREAPQEQEPKYKYTEVPGVDLWVNLTEKNVKAKIGDIAFTEFKDCYIWEEEKLLKGIQGDKVVFEITSRSKAYKELQPYARQKAEAVRINRETGDYGDYYRAHIIIKSPKLLREEI